MSDSSAKANVAQLYATPRLTTHSNSPARRFADDRNHHHRSQDINNRSFRDVEHHSASLVEDDPLSDPLYASILGTSKQLKGITSKQRQSRIGAARSASALFTGSEFFATAAANSENIKGTPIYDNLAAVTPTKKNNNNNNGQINGSNNNYEAHLSDSSVDSASLQLKSLVERCLEVQRATQNNRSLLSISSSSQTTNQVDQDHDQAKEDPAEEEEDLLKTTTAEQSIEKFGALRQKQM